MNCRQIAYSLAILWVAAFFLPAAWAGLSKKSHLDLQVGFTFKPPTDWKGVPPSSKYLGEGMITAGGSETKCERIGEYRNPKVGENIHIRIFYIGGARGSLSKALDIFRSGVSNTYRVKTFGDAVKVRVGRSAAMRFTAELDRGFTLRGTISTSKKRAVGVVELWDGRTDLGLIETMHKAVDTMAILPKAKLGGLRARYGRTVQLSDWKTLKTKYYIVDYNVDDEFAKKMTDHMMAMQSLYRKLFPTNKKDRFRVKVFANQRGFHKYSGTPPGVVAYFSPGQGELCCYKTAEVREIKVDGGEVIKIGKGMAQEEVLRVMSHEGWHQFLAMYVGKNRFANLPMWFNEGMAEYFFTGKIGAKGKFTTGLHSWRIGPIMEMVTKGKHIPLSDFLAMDRSAYYSNPTACYAQGWSLCFFLLTSSKRKYNTIPQKMMHWLKRSGDGSRTMRKVFSKIDLKKLEQEWLDFQAGMEVPAEMMRRR